MLGRALGARSVIQRVKAVQGPKSPTMFENIARGAETGTKMGVD
jgi:hypothetical protein